MPDFNLDLSDPPRMVDFLVAASPYASGSDRQVADKLVQAYQDGDKVPTQKLIEAANKLAAATWPARYAVDRALVHEEPDEEWRRVTAAVRPSTALLMKRFRQGVGAKSLDEVLRHVDVDTALHDEEMSEIDEIRAQVRQEFWKERHDTLSVLVTAGQQEWQGYKKRLDKLRELAAVFPPVMQDEVFSKVNHYQDRILFGMELVPMEILDEEIQYYTDQKEINPLERAV